MYRHLKNVGSKYLSNLYYALGLLSMIELPTTYFLYVCVPFIIFFSTVSAL